MAAIGSDGKMMELSAYVGKFRRYVRSPSTRIAAFGGLMMYVSYAYAHGSWANPALIGVSVFAGVFLPSYSSSAIKPNCGLTTSSVSSRPVSSDGFSRNWHSILR